jgi:hypothetical protein
MKNSSEKKKSQTRSSIMKEIATDQLATFGTAQSVNVRDGEVGLFTSFGLLSTVAKSSPASK